MNYFPSPPASPTPSTFDEDDDYMNINDNDKVICGSCDKPLSSDWFCSDCHKKCTICNRFLTNEQCSRCWVFDPFKNTYVRKQQQQPTYYYYSHYSSYFMPNYHYPSSFLHHQQPQQQQHYQHEQQYYNYLNYQQHQQHQQQQKQYPYPMVPLKH
ncbi:unnamed protein product [Cunninghamella blakesleeana]